MDADGIRCDDQGATFDRVAQPRRAGTELHPYRNALLRWYRRLRALYDLRSPDDGVRAAAVDVLAELDDPSARQRIVAAFRDESPLVRSRAGDALVRADRFDPLVEALRDERAEVRAEAADALGDLGDRRAVPLLIDALADPSVAVRATAAYALGDLRDLRAVQPLIAILADPEPAARRIATYALGNLGDPSAMEAILEGLSDADPEVRTAASSAVHKLEDGRTGDTR